MNEIDVEFSRLTEAVQKELGPMAAIGVKYESTTIRGNWYVADITQHSQKVNIAELSKTSARDAVDKALSVLRNRGKK